MVVDDLDLIGASVAPDEANSELVIHPDAMLAGPVADQRFQVTAWVEAKVVKRDGGMQQHQTLVAGASNRLQSTRLPGGPEFFRVPVSE